MPDITFNFVGPTYTSISPVIDDERAVNCYCEKSEAEGARTRIALIKRPGKKLHASLPEPFVACLESVNGRTFAAGSNLYEITAGGGQTNLGSLGATPVKPPQIRFNETQALIKNNGNLYVLTLATNVLTPVNMAQFNGPVSQIEFIDGYFFATLDNSHTYQVSNLEDGTTWDGLNIATLSLAPDNIQSMKVSNRRVYLASGKKMIPLQNIGGGFPPFAPVPDTLLEFGVGATYAMSSLENTLLWLDQTDRGFMVARVLTGGTSQRISTHAVEQKWQSYIIATDAISFTYQENGHDFWQIYFPTANATWVYDISTGYWHERSAWNEVAGIEGADRAISHTFNFGVHLIGDWASGNIYQMSSQLYTDADNIIRVLRRAPTVSQTSKRIFHRRMELDMQTGLGPQPPLTDGNGMPRAPQITVRWSNDGGFTWNSDRVRNCGKAGEFSTRVVFNKLGQARKRVYEAVYTDPTALVFADAYLDAVGGID